MEIENQKRDLNSDLIITLRNIYLQAYLRICFVDKDYVASFSNGSYFSYFIFSPGLLL